MPCGIDAGDRAAHRIAAQMHGAESERTYERVNPLHLLDDAVMGARIL